MSPDRISMADTRLVSASARLLRAADNRYNGIRKHFRKLFVYDWGLCRTRRQCSSLGTMSHLKVPFELMDSDSGEKRFFEPLRSLLVQNPRSELSL